METNFVFLLYLLVFYPPLFLLSLLSAISSSLSVSSALSQLVLSEGIIVVQSPLPS